MEDSDIERNPESLNDTIISKANKIIDLTNQPFASMDPKDSEEYK